MMIGFKAYRETNHLHRMNVKSTHCGSSNDRTKYMSELLNMRLLTE